MSKNIHDDDKISKNFDNMEYVANEPEFITVESIQKTLKSNSDILSIIDNCQDQETKIQVINLLFEDNLLDIWLSEQKDMVKLMESLIDETLIDIDIFEHINKLFQSNYLYLWLPNQKNIPQLIDLFKMHQKLNFIDILFDDQYFQYWFEKHDVIHIMESLISMNDEGDKYLDKLFEEQYISSILVKQNEILLELISYCIDCSREDLIKKLLNYNRTKNILMFHKDIFQIKNYINEKAVQRDIMLKFNEVIFTKSNLEKWLKKHDIDEIVFSNMINDLNQQDILLEFLVANKSKFGDFINRFHEIITADLPKNYRLKNIISDYINQKQNILSSMQQASDKPKLLNNLIDMMKKTTIQKLFDKKNISLWIDNVADAKKILFNVDHVHFGNNEKNHLRQWISKLENKKIDLNQSTNTDTKNSFEQPKSINYEHKTFMDHIFYVIEHFVNIVKKMFMNRNTNHSYTEPSSTKTHKKKNLTVIDKKNNDQKILHQHRVKNSKNISKLRE